MTATSAALHYCIWGILPARRPGVSAATVQAALLSDGIDRALTSIKQVLPRLRRDGYVESQGIAGQSVFTWWRTAKVMHEPPAVRHGRPLGTAVARASRGAPEREPAPTFTFRYPTTATQLRGRPTKLFVPVYRGPEVPSDIDIVGVWARRNDIKFDGWDDLPIINRERVRQNKAPFAQPIVVIEAPTSHPAIRP